MVEIVCPGFHSCLDSHIMESPKPHTIHHSNPNNSKGGWNFLEAVSIFHNVSVKDTPTTSNYYSTVRLSPKSLELCTEKLGSETGSDERMENEESESLYSSWTSKQERKSSTQKVTSKNFPPPLTTSILHMRPHREDGRLVIEVTTKLPSNASSFQAERSHGRLRLSFLKYLSSSSDDDDDELEQQVEKEMNGVGEIEREEEGEGDGEDERDKSGGIIRIMGKHERGRSRCKGYGFHAVKIFQHLEILFIKL